MRRSSSPAPAPNLRRLCLAKAHQVLPWPPEEAAAQHRPHAQACFGSLGPVWLRAAGLKNPMGTTLHIDATARVDRKPPKRDRVPDTHRWRLNRAGIINVYQYGNETLQFGGGRLLLRGVNGSGKSTAMNMLLPFLLDGQTRHIDAAGEQSGILRSWMLSGREELQPLGYLWLELTNGDAHLSFGCGIRANRSTDQVTTWWFITSRRPGIDLHLIEGRVPLSRDALKAAIEPEVVYSQEQRASYRAELRKRLFGGAEIEQHLHLLRIVRNPRVGDRLDAELPQYLQDALPQLSEAALDDAAQPLEDLEEHRRNVANLRATAEALAAMQAIYRNYARTELHRIADRTIDAVRDCDRRRREEEKARGACQEATRRHDQAEEQKRRLDADVKRGVDEISALEASDAYKSGTQLNDLRNHVESLARNQKIAEDLLEGHRAATTRAADAARRARREVEEDHVELRRRLSDLNGLARACRLTARPPGVPTIAPRGDSLDGLELAPDAVDTTTAAAQLSDLRTAARQRLGDVQAVDAALRAVEPAERVLRDAERAVSNAEAEHREAQNALMDARVALQAAATQWQSAASEWIDRLCRHNSKHELAAPVMATEDYDVVGEVANGQSVAGPLRSLIEPVIRHHEGRRANLDTRLAHQREVVTALENRAAELASKQLPDPPTQPWQQRVGRCLGELTDFQDHVSPANRANLEAALEAAGLLAAEVLDDGTLRLADGQLVLAPYATDTPAPLSRLLRADVSNEDADFTIREAVERILRAISTDPAGGSDTVVTVDGEFRIGAVRGKHVKPEPEHIGLAARRAALARQRADAASALEQAQRERDRVTANAEATRAALDEAHVLREEIPSEQSLIATLSRRGDTEDRFEKEDQRLRERRAMLNTAERQHAEIVSRARGTAARLSLPPACDELDVIRGDLDRTIIACHEAQSDLTRLEKAIERWRDCGENWRAARTDEQRSQGHLASVSREWTAARTRLDTLEASIGTAYEKVVTTIEQNRRRLSAAREELEQVDGKLKNALRDVATTGERHRTSITERQQADQASVRVLAVLRRVLAVPGLVDAAIEIPTDSAPADAGTNFRSSVYAATVNSGHAETIHEASTDTNMTATEAAAAAFPLVEDTPVGARRLAEAIHAQIPRPEDPPTTADGVRQSIRRRRDALGAGWDAEDRQPDEQLPLHVEVNGPLAQQTALTAATEVVRRQLKTMTSLLSAKQHQALRNLLQGLVAHEVAEKLHAAGELIARMNERLSAITTAHGIGVSLRWRRRDDLDPDLASTIDLLAKPPDLRTADEDRTLIEALGRRIDDAHRDDPGTPYRELIARVLDYRDWHHMTIMLHRGGRAKRLSRRTALSEGEKKIVSYLPLFAAVAASCDGLAAHAPEAPRFVLLDDAFAKVSEDNHAKLFGLLVELDLDFIATSERLWGTHETVPELAIAEVIRDADLQTIVLEHSQWDARRREHA